MLGEVGYLLLFLYLYILSCLFSAVIRKIEKVWIKILVVTGSIIVLLLLLGVDEIFVNKFFNKPNYFCTNISDCEVKNVEPGMCGNYKCVNKDWNYYKSFMKKCVFALSCIDFDVSCKCEDNVCITEVNENQTSIWDEIVDTTWRKNNDWAGELVVFYEDSLGEKKCIHQVLGSGVNVISRKYCEFKEIDLYRIEVDGEVYNLNWDSSLNDYTDFQTLYLFDMEPLVYKQIGLEDMDYVKGENFDIGDI